MYSINCDQIENGNLLKTKKTKKYTIINYNKETVISEDLGNYRSIIINNNNKIVSFSPPKSIKYNDFKEMNNISDVYFEEIVEGTMLHMFYDCEKWNISTKFNIDAKSSYFYYGNYKRTFSKMFYETVETFEDKEWMNKLNKDYCYSFVLQHPYNRIVVPLFCKKLYLISIYKIVNNEIYTIHNSEEMKNMPKEMNYPENYNIHDYFQVENLFNDIKDYNKVGVMMKNKTTQVRSKIINPIFSYVKQLRGNQPKLQYHFITLKKNDRVEEYLHYYEEHRDFFEFYEEQYNELVETLYHYYNTFQDKHSKKIPYYLRKHLFQLSKEKNVDKSHIFSYLKTIDEAIIMHTINYNLK